MADITDIKGSMLEHTPLDITDIISQYHTSTFRLRGDAMSISLIREGETEIVSCFNVKRGLWTASFTPYTYTVDGSYHVLILRRVYTDISTLPSIQVPRQVSTDHKLATPGVICVSDAYNAYSISVFDDIIPPVFFSHNDSIIIPLYRYSILEQMANYSLVLHYNEKIRAEINLADIPYNVHVGMNIQFQPDDRDKAALIAQEDDKNREELKGILHNADLLDIYPHNRVKIIFTDNEEITYDPPFLRRIRDIFNKYHDLYEGIQGQMLYIQLMTYLEDRASPLSSGADITSLANEFLQDK